MTAGTPEPGQAAYLAWHRSRYPGQPSEVGADRWANYGNHARSCWEAAAKAVLDLVTPEDVAKAGLAAQGARPAPGLHDPAPGVSFTADRQAAGKPDITGIQAALHGRTPQPAPELDAADSLVRDILESLCRRDGLSVESAVVPGEAARNYELAIRLGIGQVFGLAAATPARPAPELAAAMAALARVRAVAEAAAKGEGARLPESPKGTLARQILEEMGPQ